MCLMDFVNAPGFEGPSKHPVICDPAADLFFSKNSPLDVDNVDNGPMAAN